MTDEPRMPCINQAVNEKILSNYLFSHCFIVQYNVRKEIVDDSQYSTHAKGCGNLPADA
jgi:hypothetical protein